MESIYVQFVEVLNLMNHHMKKTALHHFKCAHVVSNLALMTLTLPVQKQQKE